MASIAVIDAQRFTWTVERILLQNDRSRDQESSLAANSLVGLPPVEPASCICTVLIQRVAL
jgi:hypothetical protein